VCPVSRRVCLVLFVRGGREPRESQAVQRSLFLSSVLPLILLAGLVGCGDDPFRVVWEENPIETTLFSLDREDLNRPSAYDMLSRRRVVVESPQAQGQWDFAVDRRDGQMVILPPRALGVTSDAAVAALPGFSLDEVREAPRDTLMFVTREPIPIEFGTVYVVRTHQQAGRFGQRCNFYGKLEAVEIDSEAGVFRFLNDTNPECNSRRLVPRGS